MKTLLEPVNDVIPTSLVHTIAPLEEVNNNMGFLFVSVDDDKDEKEQDESSEEAE